ncbi:MAG: DMT family transporter [Hyphomicrobiales bacterium]|nr:DMT family transporter [Hyphomicrobiales bacterium]
MQRFLLWSAPGIFVLLWSTGFIGARLGLPYAEPFTFLFIRFALVLVLLIPVAWFTVKKWPNIKLLAHSALVGILLHGGYLGGVFFAIDRGMPAGVSALIVSLQPILTLLLARIFINEKISVRTVGLFLVGLLGVGMVLVPGINGEAMTFPVSSLIASAVAVFGISLGTIYQKHYAGGTDLLAGLSAQYFGATVLTGVLAFSTETMKIEPTGEFLFAMFWLIFVMSFGAVGLLMFLISRDSVARTSVLFFLVPGFTLLIANIMFGETMTYVQLAGLVVASAAVAFVTTRKQ